MPDFLDRFGDQLRAAQEPRTQEAPSRSRRLSFGRPRSIGVRRGLLVGFAALGLAAPALAVVQPWNPVLGRPSVDGPVASDSTQVARSAVDVLAVLRRPQSAQDRTDAAPRLQAIGNQIDNVQTASIRALTGEWILVPANTVQTGSAQTTSEQLCITNGDVVACGPAATVSQSGVGLRGATKSGTTLVGLVPDGVARVRFTPATSKAVEVDVQSNFYAVSVPETAPAASVNAPKGYDGPTTIPGPPTPIEGTVDWLSNDGQVVGPEIP